jgi:hypothetical protein
MDVKIPDTHAKAKARLAAIELILNEWPIENQEVKEYLEQERENLIDVLEFEEAKVRS